MQCHRILLVEDQPDILELLRKRLAMDGYEVEAAVDGDSALKVFQRFQPDLVILNLLLPELEGLTVCRRIRMLSSVPILILSSVLDESAVVLALELGADDYLTKPFRMNELAVRLRILLRRHRTLSPEKEATETRDVLVAGSVALDRTTCEARIDGRRIPLTPLEFRLLGTLMECPGQVLSREVILETVWGYDGYDVGLVNTRIKRLRAKVERDPANPELIQTVRGFGYKLAA